MDGMGNHKDVYKSSDSEYYAGFHWPIGHAHLMMESLFRIHPVKIKMMWAMETPITTGPNPLFNYDYIDYSVVQQT